MIGWTSSHKPGYDDQESYTDSSVSDMSIQTGPNSFVGDFKAAKGGESLVSSGRATFVHLMLLLFSTAIIGQAIRIQVLNRDLWKQRANEQYLRETRMLTPRGAILDATDNVLAETRGEVELAIAPRRFVEERRSGRVVEKIDKRADLRKRLQEVNIPDSTIRRIFNDPRKRRVVLRQTVLPADAERFRGFSAVERRAVAVRINSAPAGLRGLVGAVNDSGAGIGGIELDLDPYLRGEAGRAGVILDGTGGRVRSPSLNAVDEKPGHTVVLTINRSLQEIAEHALAKARKRTGASGGDVLILDPIDGSVLALAGVRNGKTATTSTPLAEAYEPGSVMKPFVISRLLDKQRVHPDDVIGTENGRWLVAGRTLRDEHKASEMSVRDIVRVSSNIGTAKLAMRFSTREEYESLRDFGFGSYTGLPYPAESRGRLPLPKDWGGMTPASVAIGYEMMATPLQIAAAYAALATDGALVQPALVREVRDADGRAVYKHERQVVRQVVSPSTAALMREMLKSVVDSGTGQAANLSTFDVAGKSGTARRLIPGEAYAAGRYNATFAGIFPIEDPQYVIVARLIDPEGTYFGGVVSGAMVKSILQDALAARNASLDRAALARVAKPPAFPVGNHFKTVKVDTASTSVFNAKEVVKNISEEVSASPVRVLVDLPFSSQATIPRRVRSDAESITVPSVAGLDARAAILSLSAAGFSVDIIPGSSVRTIPDAGVLLRPGAKVKLIVPNFSAKKVTKQQDGVRR